jgi:nucleoside-diphosphate-sugar epimerase
LRLVSVFQNPSAALQLTFCAVACKLGVKKIIIASSETTYGVCFAQGDADYHSFPLEEDYDVDPEDSYALSKICGEKTARTVS